MRWQLIQWGFAKSEVKVDEKTMTMKVGGVPVLPVKTFNNEVVNEWVDKGWEKWEEGKEVHRHVATQGLLEQSRSWAAIDPLVDFAAG